MKVSVVKILVFLLLTNISSYAQELISNENLAYWYKPNYQFRIKHYILTEDSLDQTSIFFKISSKQKIDSALIKLKYFTYETASKNNTSSVDSLTSLDIHSFKKDSDDYIIKVKVPTNESNIYFFKFMINNHSIWHEVFIDQQRASSLVIEKENKNKIFNNYIASKESLKLINNSSIDSSKIFIYYSSQEFKAAYPPMFEKNIPLPTFNIDSSFALQTNTLTRLNNKGLYYFKQDSSNKKLIFLRVEDSHYPKYTTPEQLIEPLIYMSTKEEFETLRTAKDKKQALDKFWIKIGKTKANARQLIKQFYQHVIEANMLFTSFKEGWKTDQGIIYIFMGAPDIVKRQANLEEWIYTEKKGDVPPLKFTFVKHVFPHRAVLIRKGAYEKYWFSIVDLWRKSM